MDWKIRRSACTQHELFHLRPSRCSQNSPPSSPANECQSPFRMTRRRWSRDSRITASGLIKVYINKSVSYANPNHAEAAETITTDETTGRGAVGHLFLTSSRLSNFFFFFFVFLGAKNTESFRLERRWRLTSELRHWGWHASSGRACVRALFSSMAKLSRLKEVIMAHRLLFSRVCYVSENAFVCIFPPLQC